MSCFLRASLLLLPFLLFVLEIEIGSAQNLKCYVCSGAMGHAACDNDLGSEHQSECQAGEICHKHILNKPEMRVMHRRCEKTGICERLEKQYNNTPRVSVEDCLECEEPLCNSAISGIMTFSLIGVIAAISTILLSISD